MDIQVVYLDIQVVYLDILPQPDNNYDYQQQGREKYVEFCLCKLSTQMKNVRFVSWVTLENGQLLWAGPIQWALRSIKLGLGIFLIPSTRKFICFISNTLDLNILKLINNFNITFCIVDTALSHIIRPINNLIKPLEYFIF